MSNDFPIVYRLADGRKASTLVFLVFALLLASGFGFLLVVGLSVLVYEVTGRSVGAGLLTGILVGLACLVGMALFAAAVTRGATSEVRIFPDQLERLVWGGRRRLPFARLAAVQLYHGEEKNHAVLTLRAIGGKDVVLFGHSWPVEEIATRVADLARGVLEERIRSALQAGRSVDLTEDQAWQTGERCLEWFKAGKYLLGGVVGLLAMGYVVARGESVLVPGAVSLVFLAIGALGLRELLRWRGHGLRLSSSGVSDARWKGNRQIAWSEVRAIEESRGGIWIGGADSEAGLTRDGENYLVLPAILKSLVPKEALWKKR